MTTVILLIVLAVTAGLVVTAGMIVGTRRFTRWIKSRPPKPKPETLKERQRRMRAEELARWDDEFNRLEERDKRSGPA